MSMSGVDRGSAKPGVPFDAVALIGVLALAVLVVLFFAGGRNQQIRVSPSGFDGLTLWLVDAGVDAQSFNGGWTIPAGDVGLNIIPLYDAALDADRVPPSDQEDLLLQRDEYDLDPERLRAKVDLVPTLLILPKWRTGLRLTGLAHPVLLIDRRDTSALLDDVLFRPARSRVTHIPRVFNEFSYEATDGTDLQAELYVAQTFDAGGCEPLVGQAGEIVLGRCALGPGGDGQEIYILSDPDLLNNHGLRLGDNARIARDVIASLAGDRRVIVDYSQDNWLVAEDSYDHPDRTWADLARFFAYPFTILWVAGGLILALFIWRGSVRFGPVTDSATELAASKSVMIGARARLMRLTGQDGALVGAYVRARLAAAAAHHLGPQEAGRGEQALLRYARRRDPDLADRLEDRLARLRQLPPHLAAEAAIEHVDEFERLLEQLSDDT